MPSAISRATYRMGYAILKEPVPVKMTIAARLAHCVHDKLSVRYGAHPQCQH